MKKILYIILTFIITLFPVVQASADDLNIGVLCYHSVSDNPLTISTYRISDTELEEDLQYFTEHGYTFMLPREMWLASSSNKNLVLTFDDGYTDFYEVVFPLLQKYNVKAAVYVIGSKIDKHGYLSSEQIKELDASGIVEIGNHTNIMHSYNYVKSTFEDSTAIVTEYIEDVKECSRRIYEILGHGTESIAYPNGQYIPLMDEVLRTNLGYTTTFTTNHGLVRTVYDIKSPMKRIYRIHNRPATEIERMINDLK